MASRGNWGYRDYLFDYRSKEKAVLVSRRFYYWLVAKGEDGKTFLIFGSEHSEEECRQKGLEMLQGVDFQVVRLPTRDLATASSMWRGKRLDVGEGLHRSTQRLGHDKSIRRLRRKQRMPDW